MTELIRKMGYQTIGQDFYGHIKEWEAWYKGKVHEFHRYTQYNGVKSISRERATLGAAKRVCEDWANLLLSEKVDVVAKDEATTKRLARILDENSFRVRGNQLVELAFALGTGAFVEYLEGKRVRIDYIRADMIYPISWDNGSITECAFASEKVIGGNPAVYVQAHVREEGRYVIVNRLFHKHTGQEMPLPDGIRPVFQTKSEIPLFQIIRPNTVNNMDFDNPMGISVFAGAVDVLKGLDLVFDSLCNEFRLGKKRIIVPASMAQIMHHETGMKPIFDTNDTEFFALPMGVDGSMELKEINMDLRAVEHKEGLALMLGLLSSRCGLGNERYRFEAGGLRTATEVISRQNDLYQNLRKHELLLRQAIVGLSRAALALDGLKDAGEIKVDFDDSVMIDRQAEVNERLKLVDMELMSHEEFRVWYFNETEQGAREKLQKQSEKTEQANEKRVAQ